jgi:hypothetical protein
MSRKKNKKPEEKTVLVDEMMTFGRLDDGRHTVDFITYENVDIAPFTAICKVQVMRGGNVYVTEYEHEQ